MELHSEVAHSRSGGDEAGSWKKQRMQQQRDRAGEAVGGAELVPEQRCGTGLSAGHGSRTSSAGEKDAMALADAGLGDEFTPARDMAGRRLVRGDGAWRGGDRGDELEEVLGRLGGSASDACNEEEGARAPASRTRRGRGLRCEIHGGRRIVFSL